MIKLLKMPKLPSALVRIIYGKSSVSLVEPVVYAAEAKMMLGDKQGAIENFAGPIT